MIDSTLPRCPGVRLALAGLALLSFPALPADAQWTFTDVTATAGVGLVHELRFGFSSELDMMSGGAAGGDLDRDGDIDLVLLRGNAAPARVLLNQGNGVFTPGSQISFPLTGDFDGPNGLSLADVDGDGDLDLLTGGFNGFQPRLYLNDGNAAFTDATAGSGISTTRAATWSAAFGDYDGDGRLDLFLGHWNRDLGGGEHLWRNLGGGQFQDVGAAAGVDAPFAVKDHTFTPVFTDIDNDGDADLVVSADFNNSQVFKNRGDGTFETVTDEAVITDENGMGVAVGDYDNDGDLDWFVSSIWDPDQDNNGQFWGVTGNRLYRNDGTGVFSDVTTEAGVRIGFWGWGSCFEDLDLDGDLDLLHVNGMPAAQSPEFHADPTRLFVNNGDGTFAEQSAALGIVETGQGRGVVCADFDGDGDADLLLNNNGTATRLYRNDPLPGNHYLKVRLAGEAPNTWGIGAKVWLTTAAGTQLREIRAGNNFLSSNPSEALFGLGAATVADTVRVVWPGGGETVLRSVVADQTLVISQIEFEGVDVPIGGWGLAGLAALLALAGLFLLRR
ncbi:MAG TPA: CRTAC1 family protein [Thermoanaerobaculia bacterium]|nr:CRTAC1 family protein [Thermoanaerobaculia bacterium]